MSGRPFLALGTLAEAGEPIAEAAQEVEAAPALVAQDLLTMDLDPMAYEQLFAALDETRMGELEPTDPAIVAAVAHCRKLRQAWEAQESVDSATGKKQRRKGPPKKELSAQDFQAPWQGDF